VLVGRYMEALADVPDLTLPHVPEWADPSWHLFVVRHPQRDALQKHLTALGIGTLIHYPIPPHLSEAYREMGFKQGDFPITESIHQTALSLPMGPHLSAEQLERVVEGIRLFRLISI